MKIHFCELCNESVPQSALDSGAAKLVKGRVICAACDAAMSHVAPHAGSPAPGDPTVHAPHDHAPHRAHGQPFAAPPAYTPHSAERPVYAAGPDYSSAAAPAVAVAAAPFEPRAPVHAAPATAQAAPAPAGSNAGLAWVAGLAIAFTALSIFVTDDRLARLGRSQSALETELARKDEALRALSAEFGKVHPALAGVETRLIQRFDAADARSVASGEAQSALRADVSRFGARLDGLASEVEKLRARANEPGLGTELERRFDELSARIAKADDERRALAEQIASAPPPAAAAAAEATPAVAPAAPPAWTKHVADLGSADETVRWDAVTSLGATNDPAVVSHLLPMLKDTTWLVRMAAARVLGEMRVREAVTPLIAMLEDADSAARETAWIALRTITGKDLKFDSFAPEAERQKRAKAWSDWWKKEGGADAAPKETAGS